MATWKAAVIPFHYQSKAASLGIILLIAPMAAIREHPEFLNMRNGWTCTTYLRRTMPSLYLGELQFRIFHYELFNLLPLPYLQTVALHRDSLGKFTILAIVDNREPRGA